MEAISDLYKYKLNLFYVMKNNRLYHLNNLFGKPEFTRKAGIGMNN